MLDPNAQCFLLPISHRNRLLSTSNCPPPSPQRGETRPHKPVNGRQERGGIRHAWQIFIKASLDEVRMGCASMSSMEHIQNQRIHLLKYNVWLFLSFKLVGMKEETILFKEWFSLSTFTLMKIFIYIRHLLYNGSSTSNQDQATRAENNPSSLQRDKIRRSWKGFSDLIGFFLAFFFFFFFSLSRNSEKHSSEWQSVSQISWIIWQPQCSTSNFITAHWMFWGFLQWFLHL